MHFISETRYNPNLQCDDKYYRIKESFRDLTGRVRCRIMLNVGFMTPRLRPEDVRDIAKCLTYMSDHKGEQDIFGGSLSKYNDTVKSKAKEYWSQMIELGKIDAVKKSIEDSRAKAEKLVDVKTIKHTDARMQARRPSLAVPRKRGATASFSCWSCASMRKVSSAIPPFLLETLPTQTLYRT